MLALPVLVWLALFLAIASFGRPVREAALAAFTAVAVATLTFTEILSLVHALSFVSLSAAWAIVLLVSTVALWHRIRLGAHCVWQSLAAKGWGATDWLIAVILAFFALGTLMSALLYPIVNDDSLTAHAARVWFWYQNHSVAPFPTPFGPQIFEGPLGAYLVLTAKILAGGTDRAANLVQWLSYVLSVVTVSLIAMRLGATRRGQQVAAIAAAVTPLAILQASTTQNDLVVAVWCLIAVYCAITYVVSPPEEYSTGAWVLWAGGALGLALLAKPTAYMFCFPYFAWLTIVVARRDGWKRMVALASAALLIALLLNSAWYVANARLLGHEDVLGLRAPGNTQTESRDDSPVGVFTDALKNGSMELGTPLASLNSRTSAIVAGLVGDYSGNVNDPRTEEDTSDTYRLDNRVTNHDVAPAPLTVALIALACVVLLGYRRVPPATKIYIVCGAAGGFLAAGLITYNYYINRLFVGDMLLLVPTIGVALTVLKERESRVLRFVLVALLVFSVAWGAIIMVFNSTNRLVPPSFSPVPIGSSRNLGYWNTSYDDLRFRVLTPDLEGPFKSVAEAIRAAGVTRVGIYAHVPMGRFQIYPLLSLLSDRNVTYVGDTLFPDKIKAQGPKPQVIVEIVESDQYPQVLADGRPRGKMLLPAQHGTDHVLLVYYAQ